MAQLKETTINGTLTTSGSILPGTDEAHDLGSTSANWRAVYAASFIGTLTGNVTGNVTGNASTASALTTQAVGNEYTPVYFDDNGTPVACKTFDSTDRRWRRFDKLDRDGSYLGLIGRNYSSSERSVVKLEVDETGNGFVSLPIAENESGKVGLVACGYTTDDTNRNYAVQVGNNNNLYVHVPWKNTWQQNAINTDGYVPAPTSSNTNKIWMTDNEGNPDWRSAPMNATGVAGYVSATDSLTTNKVWKTDEHGKPGWRDDADTHCTVTNKDETLAWGTKTTIANVGGTDITVALPDNPDTDTTYSAGTNISISGSNNAINVVNSPSFSGSVTASSFYANSDRRLKKDIRPYSTDYSSIIDSIPVYLFSYLSDKEGKTAIGTVAQELRDILPEELREAFISGEETENTYLSISEQKLTYLLIGAFKEEKAKREALEAEVADLKAKVAKLLGD